MTFQVDTILEKGTTWHLCSLTVPTPSPNGFILKDNHEKHHIFFNDIKLHNHVTHHVLALWRLVTIANWTDQLGLSLAAVHDNSNHLKPGQNVIEDTAQMKLNLSGGSAHMLLTSSRRWSKMRELHSTVSILYAVSAFNTGKNFSADFFLMQLVTSLLFLHAYVPFLTPSSMNLTVLLRSHMVTFLACCVAACGRRPLDITTFYIKTAPNDASSILEEDDHLCNLQRTFADYATLYGSRTAGLSDFAHTELPGSEVKY
ncbi:hypothetical protein BDZ89DRAFT_1154772 [Hymenopellis radicata]|nr:hypothetical protein BDZ89DRAFT_1154772 [Hymenopellis radicata]